MRKAQSYDLVLADGVLYATEHASTSRGAVLTALQAQRPAGAAAATPPAKP